MPHNICILYGDTYKDHYIMIVIMIMIIVVISNSWRFLWSFSREQQNF